MDDDAGKGFDGGARHSVRAVGGQGTACPILEMRLDVAASDVKKLRRPGFRVVRCLRELTPDRAAPAAAHRDLVRRTVFVRQFGRNEPDASLACIDAANGKVVWRVSIRAISPTLLGKSPRMRWRRWAARESNPDLRA